MDIGALLLDTIDRFCPDVEKDLLLSPDAPKGQDNLDVLLQIEHVLLEMGT
jgi:hypothetical protein